MENTDQRGTGIENGSEWSNGTVHFDRTGPTGKSGPPRKVDRFFRNFSGWNEPIHSVLDRNFRKFWFNGSRPRTAFGRPHLVCSPRFTPESLYYTQLLMLSPRYLPQSVLYTQRAHCLAC